jgi:predicted nucleotidyltransferase
VSVNAAPTLTEVRAKREPIERALASRGARNPRVFGSVARGDAVADSDVDLLVDFDGLPPSGFHYFGMIRELQDELAAILGRPVHVVRVTQSSPGGQRVLGEAVPL